MTHPFTAEELLAHSGFLRGLARELVGDAHAAADVVQDAYTTALEHPPRETGSRCGWLAIVVANLARNARRAGRRRGERERAVARPERVESGERALERLDVQRVLIELLVALPEEQRTVLYLRYYEERTPTAIAAQLGVPVKTIKTRHTRALAELRRKLDERSQGDRTVWVSALACLPGPRWSPPGSPLVGLPKWAVLAFGGVLVAVVFLWGPYGKRVEPLEVAVGAAATAVESRAQTPASAAREPLAPLSTAAPRRATCVLTGTVRTMEDDRPVAGATVLAYALRRALAEAPRATTDDAGRYRFEWPAALTLQGLAVLAAEETTAVNRWMNLRISPGAASDLDLWVTRGATLEGNVVDAEGAPVFGARVRAWCNASFDPAKPADRSAVTAGDGRFRIEHLGEDFVLTAEAAGLACERGLRGKLAPGASVNGLQMTLTEAAEFRGHVVDANGRPVAEASLDVHGSGSSSKLDGTLVSGVSRFTPIELHARSDESGAFVLGPAPRGRLGARVTHPLFLDQDETLAPEPADNRLTLDAGNALSGRVTAWTGAPAAGAQVSVRAGAGSWRETTADERGLFALHALGAGDDAFVLVAADDNALFARQPFSIGPAGEGFLDLHLERPAPLAGRVLDPEGQPVVDALIHVEGDRVLDYEGVDFGEKTTLEWAANANEARTDDAGRFRFANLYAGRFQVRVSPPDEPRLWTEVEMDSGREDLLIVLDRGALERVVFSGRVVDSVTGAPIRAFTVVPMRCEKEGSGQGSNFGFGPEADGRFRLAGFEPGRYELDVQAAGHARWKGELRGYRAGESSFDVELAPACALQLIVRDERGQPLNRSAKVECRDLDGRALSFEWGGWSSTSADVGQEPQAVSGLPRAPVRLSASCPNYLETTLDLDLTVPPTDPVVLVLHTDPLGVRASFHITVLVTNEPELAGTLTPELGRAAYEAGRIRIPEAAVQLDFLDARGEPVAQGTLTPLADGRFRSRSALFVEMQSSEMTLEQPTLSTDMPMRCRELVARAEGCREEHLALELDPAKPNVIGVVLLRQGGR